MAGASTQNFLCRRFWKFSEVIFSGLNICPFSYRQLLSDCNGKNTMVVLIVASVWMCLQALVIDFCLRYLGAADWFITESQKSMMVFGRFGEFILID